MGLTKCLAAHGATLWQVDKRHWWSPRHTLNSVARVGTADSPKFAQEVHAAKHEIVRSATVAGRETLLIGVPVIREETISGVFEVQQRVGSRPTTQMGYVRFIRQVGDIVAGSGTLTK